MVGDMETRVVESSPTFSETLMPITEVTEGETIKYVTQCYFSRASAVLRRKLFWNDVVVDFFLSFSLFSA